MIFSTRSSVGVAALALAGCISTAPAEPNSDVIPTHTFSCKKPYALTQDCTVMSGAKREIAINGFDLRVAGSADGRVVLVMDAHLFANTFKDPVLNSPSHSEATNSSYRLARNAIERAGIEVLRVRRLESFKNIDGYVLELSGDGYGALKALTKPGS